MGWCLKEALRPEAVWASFAPGTGDEKAQPCQLKITAVQSSPACMHALASQQTSALRGAELSNLFCFFLFELYFACCDNRTPNLEQHYETSEIDISIS